MSIRIDFFVLLFACLFLDKCISFWFFLVVWSTCRLDPEETLVIVVSKTFTTAETMLNARTMKDWLLTSMKGKATPADITRQHMVSRHVGCCGTPEPLWDLKGKNGE